MKLTRKIIYIWYRLTFCLSLLLWPPAYAETSSTLSDFDFNAQGISAAQFSGRTVIAASRDTEALWSLYFSPDKTVVVTVINPAEKGTTTDVLTQFSPRSGLWSMPEKDVVCLQTKPLSTPSLSSNVTTKQCFFASRNGRGTDWRVLEKIKQGGFQPKDAQAHRGEYQIVYSISGDQSSKLGKQLLPMRTRLKDLATWRGHVLVGRTLKDKESWVAKYYADGTLSFVYGSGRRFEGQYEIKDGNICMTFPATPAAGGCRGPKEVDGKLVWVATKTGAFISQVLFLLPIADESIKPSTIKPESDGVNKDITIDENIEKKDLELAENSPQSRDFTLSKGQCYAVIATRKSLAGVRKAIKKSIHPKAAVYVNAKGRYVISAFHQFSDKKVTKKLIKELISAGLLPKDTQCARGNQFVLQVDNWAKASDKKIKQALAAAKAQKKLN
jgi:hypothetical protein